MKSIGLFGGTFDPVHCGHIELARCANEVCNLDEVVFLPAAAPPHKENISITLFKHRVEMLKLAISADQNFSISTIEEKLVPPSFTIDTLKLFLKNRVVLQNYYFIIGVDAFLEIHTWKAFQKVLNRVNFIVSAREGYAAKIFLDYMTKLCYSSNGSFWYNSRNEKKIYYLEIDIPDISSSNVRESIKQENLPEDMLNRDVLQYIKDFRLYPSELDVHKNI